mgnify:CR=1 FL=1
MICPTLSEQHGSFALSQFAGLISHVPGGLGVFEGAVMFLLRDTIPPSALLPALLPAWLTCFALAFARGVGEYGSVIFIAGNMPIKTEILPLLIMVIGFYCFFATVLLMRMRLEVLRRESRSSWVKSEIRTLVG